MNKNNEITSADVFVGATHIVATIVAIGIIGGIIAILGLIF